MVNKSRAINDRVHYQVNGVIQDTVWHHSGNEAMEDNSSTGSPRTEVDAVDRFLADPTKKHDFHRALQDSAKSPGDVGNRFFQMDRIQSSWSLGNFTIVGQTGNVNTFLNYTMRAPPESAFPAVERFTMPTEAQRKARGQEQYAAALPNRSQADLGATLGEIVASPARALAIPGRKLATRVTRKVRGGTAAAGVGDDFLIAELKQRLKLEAGASLEDTRAAADDYLAFIFGARPTVQDLDDLADSISRSRRQAETVVRSSNRRLRRRVEGPADSRVLTRTTTGGTVGRAISNSFALFDCQEHFITESVHRTWWSGAFRMSSSDTSTWLGQSEQFFKYVDKLSGLGADAQTMWNLIPFSFVADWFANTGSFLENRQIIADYNIACEYGYTMNHTSTTLTAIATGTFRINNTSIAVQNAYGRTGGSLSYRKVWETKRRDRCSSYGFYTDFSNLNPQQWGALTAIGLSNVPGVPPRVRL